MERKEDKVYARLAPTWWEILAYIVLILLAVVVATFHFPKWVVIPFVLAIFLVRFARVHLVH